MLVAMLLYTVPVKKSFQTSNFFSDHTTFFKEKNKTKLGYWGIKHEGFFSWFSSEDIHSLIIYQPTDTWQPCLSQKYCTGALFSRSYIQLYSTKAPGELRGSWVPG